MALNLVLAAGVVISVMAVLFLLCSVVIVLVILIQKGKGGGLSSAFAGGMASGILGSKTGDVLTWITIGVVGVFLFTALVLDKWWKPTVAPGATGQTPAPITTSDTGLPAPAEQEPTGQPAPAEQTPAEQPVEQ